MKCGRLVGHDGENATISCGTSSTEGHSRLVSWEHSPDGQDLEMKRFVSAQLRVSAPGRSQTCGGRSWCWRRSRDVTRLWRAKVDTKKRSLLCSLSMTGNLRQERDVPVVHDQKSRDDKEALTNVPSHTVERLRRRFRVKRTTVSVMVQKRRMRGMRLLVCEIGVWQRSCDLLVHDVVEITRRCRSPRVPWRV